MEISLFWLKLYTSIKKILTYCFLSFSVKETIILQQDIQSPNNPMDMGKDENIDSI